MPPKPGKYPPIVPGMKFGKLTIVREGRHGYVNGDGIFYHRRYLCRCECGRTLFVSISYLNSGMRRTCSKGLCPAHTHGLFTGVNQRRYYHTSRSYYAMVDRCTRPTNTSWPWYGGANPPITICERWMGQGGLVRFIEDMGIRPRGKTLDRKNPFLGYSPENCQWSTAKWQRFNQRRNYTPEETIRNFEQGVPELVAEAF